MAKVVSNSAFASSSTTSIYDQANERRAVPNFRGQKKWDIEAGDMVIAQSSELLDRSNTIGKRIKS